MLRIEKRLFSKKRFRRIAGAVAGIATALTFLLTRLGVAYTISLRLSKRPRSGRVTRSARTLFEPRQTDVLNRSMQSLRYGIDQVCAARIVIIASIG